MKEGNTAWRNPFVSGHCVGLVPSLLYVCGWRDESLPFVCLSVHMTRPGNKSSPTSLLTRN